MANSQLNNLSKRQILESLMYEQQQSNATLSRLMTAIARTANLSPEQLAEKFTDDKENQAFIEKFNTAVKAKHPSAPPSATPNNPQDLQPQTTPKPTETK